MTDYTKRERSNQEHYRNRYRMVRNGALLTVVLGFASIAGLMIGVFALNSSVSGAGFIGFLVFGVGCGLANNSEVI